MQDVRSGRLRESECACPVCGETIMNGEVVIFARGDLVHVDCQWSRPILRPPLARAPRRPQQRLD
jgi:hypothetical protein